MHLCLGSPGSMEVSSEAVRASGSGGHGDACFGCLVDSARAGLSPWDV